MKMKNKNFCQTFRHALRFLGVVFLVASAAPAAAQSAPDTLRADIDYTVLDPPLPTRAPEGKIEVLEFFNFSCPHCFRMQSVMAQWEKTNKENEITDVALVRQPVVFQSAGGHYARVFHTLESLGIADSLFRKVFNTIHQKRILINSSGRLAAWLDEQKLDGERAAKIYDSFSVNAKLNRDARITEEYGVTSTPHVAVAGKYLISPGGAGSLNRMMEIATLLVERERKELARKAAAE